MPTPTYIVYGSVLSGGGLSPLDTYIYDENDNLLWHGNGYTPDFFTNPNRLTDGSTIADAPQTWSGTVTKYNDSPANTILSEYATLIISIDRPANCGVLTINGANYFFNLNGMEVQKNNWFYYNGGNRGKGGSSPAVWEYLQLGISPPPKPFITLVNYNNGVATIAYSFHGVADGSVSSYGEITGVYNGTDYIPDNTHFTAHQGDRIYTEETVVVGNTYYYRVAAQRSAVINGTTYYSTLVYSDVYESTYEEAPAVSYVEIPVKAYLNLERNPASDYHAATKKYVDDSISGISGGQVPVKNETGYVFLSNATSGSAGTWTAYSTSVSNADTGLVTSGAVYTAISGLSSVYSALGHTHDTSDVTSGTFDSARIPDATGSTKGGVIVGDGLSVSSGTISVSAGAGLAIDSTSKAVKIKLDTSSGLTVSSSGIKIDAASTKTLLGLGSAAYVNTGTTSGNVPVLDGNGKLVNSVIPAIAITDTFVKSSEQQMLAITGADVGDVCVRTDVNKSFILTEAGASTLSHWQELLTPTDAVTSVNGSTGAVTITGAGLSDFSTAALTSSSTDATFSSSKAVWTTIFDGTTGKVKLANLPIVVKGDDNAYLTYIDDDTKIFTCKAVAGFVGFYAAEKVHTHDRLVSSDIEVLVPNVSVFGYTDIGHFLTSDEALAAQYSDSSAYAVGAYCVYEGWLYKCNTAIASGGEDWTPAHWTRCNVMSEVGTVVNAGGRYEGTITGNNSSTSFTITHNLDSYFVLVEVMDSSYNTVFCAVQRTSTNALTVSFAQAPGNNVVYYVIVRK